MINIGKLSRFWLIGVIICFTTVLYLFVIKGAMNAVMLAFMFVSPFFFLKYRTLRKDESLAYVLIVCIAVFPLFHIHTYRISTVLYSLLFIISYLLFRRLLFEGRILRQDYLKLIRFIAYAYFIVLLIQQVSVLAHIPVFNQCWKLPNPFKLNSLALEPSHVGRILLLISFSFVKIRSKDLGCEYNLSKNFYGDRWFWISISYVMLTCGSSNSLLCFAILVLYFLRKNATVILSALVITPLLFFLVSRMDWFVHNEAIQRLMVVIPATLSFDIPSIISADLSASARIVPPLLYIQELNVFDFNFWFGHGIDYSSRTLVNYLLNRNDIESSNAAGGVFPSFFLDYGFVAGSVFLCFLKRMALSRFLSFETLIWITCFFAAGFNTYMQWSFFLILTATHYFCSVNNGNEI